jgi:chemotaxis methyl-accepting protein methylase
MRVERKYVIFDVWSLLNLRQLPKFDVFTYKNTLMYIDSRG